MKNESILLNIKNILWNNLLVLVLLVLWLVIGWLEWNNEVFVPSLSKVIINTVTLLLTVKFWTHIIASVSVIASGFLLSVLIAIPIGIIMGSYTKANSALQNFIELIRPISPLALYPLFIFMFGIGFMSKLMIVFWVSWVPLLFNVITGVQRINENYLRMAKTLGASKIQMLTEVILPAITPWIITGMRLAMGSALLVIVAAEMIGSNKGIGFFILNASYTFKIVDLYSGILVIAIIGILINACFLLWEKRTQIYNNKIKI
jgi:ABC-type nitrate/sulfonate/bicarbonate transport system permease component